MFRPQEFKSHQQPTRGFSSGFTLVELIIAMTFFSFMMVIVSVGFLQIMKMYQSNLATRRTQQAARIVVENVSREVRAALRVVAAEPNRLCLEGAQTVEFIRQDANSGTDGVLKKRILQGNCSSNTAPISTENLAGSDLAGASDVQVRQFDASLIENGQGAAASAKVVVGITTGPQDLVDDLVCRPGAGSQFCSATIYTSVISLRGGTL